MNDDFRLDLSDVQRDILAADVLCVYFPILRKTLLVDARAEGGEKPLVRLLPMVQSFDERVKALQKLRPGFPPPKNIVVIPWAKYVDSLVGLGIWDTIIQRLALSGDATTLDDLDGALRDLRMLQEMEVLAAVRGDAQYETMWRAPEAPGPDAEPPGAGPGA